MYMENGLRFPVSSVVQEYSYINGCMGIIMIMWKILLYAGISYIKGGIYKENIWYGCIYGTTVKMHIFL